MTLTRLKCSEWLAISNSRIQAGKLPRLWRVYCMHRDHEEKLPKAEKKMQQVASSSQESKYRHNAKGDMIITNSIQMPLCDCLKPGCSGCFWPCYECGGRRCSTVCQRHRPFAVAFTAQSGGGPKDKTRITNPFLPHEYFASKKK
ncbi:hypothetical protein PRIPAC_76365 [Pristionchus pacificus]|uniref:ARF7EP_C domain-containing protein n=1 Tax=Pristionchus pacificus TaxID=54126 RepID=A0A2A6CRJ0_PRIPA|nr:hypothetical protein PRIPAC_76365 [Pristionchus pacificus]|eukprot:PDM80677.1 hypothetical protein PRIPAC_35680 [Pristionchus pacificus]